MRKKFGILSIVLRDSLMQLSFNIIGVITMYLRSALIVQ